MIDGIIFDLDGTLWDSCASVAASWQQTLRDYYNPSAVITADDIAGVMGMTADQIAAKLFSAYGDRAGEVTHHCLMEECVYCGEHGGRLYPELENVLRTLSADYKLFIVSNCQTGYIQCFLKYTGFGHYFTDFVEQGSTGLTKGENNRLLMQRHSLSNPVYIGDTLSDKTGAEFAGIPFIYASYGFGHLEGERYSVSSPAELPALIAAL